MGQKIWHNEGFRKADFLSTMLGESDRIIARGRFTCLWEDLIHEYRSRSLTKPEDRIIAFAGIAPALHNMTRMTYLAGIWGEQLATCLLWRVRDHRYRVPVEHRFRADEAQGEIMRTTPSWSWFSVPIRAHLDLVFLMPDVWMSSMPTDFVATLSSFQWSTHMENELQPNSYYEFDGIQIFVSTQTLLSNFQGHGESSRKGDITSQLTTHESIAHPSLSLHLDTIEQEEEPPDRTLLCVLLERSKETDTCFVYKLASLALVPGPNKDTWQRVGMWTLTTFSLSEEKLSLPNNSVFDLLDGSETRNLILV